MTTTADPAPYSTLEEQTYRRLLDGIHAGEYPPGTRLVGSRLAGEFRVSRITVANALKRLSSEGYVTSQPHREATVAALDAGDLHEIFLMRHALEDVVLREAAGRITPAAIADLRVTDARVRQSIEQDDVAAYRASERAFHLALYAASGLRLIAAMLMDLWSRLEPYRGRRYSELGLLPESLADRSAIVDALERGDGEAAAAAMRWHVERGHRRIQEVLRLQAASATAGEPGVRRDRAAARETRVAVVPAGSLAAALATMPDARRPQGRMFPPGPALALAVLAMLAGATSAAGVARWGQACHPAIREALGFGPHGAPSGPTMHRLLRQTDPAELAACLGAWLARHGLPAVAGGDDGFALARQIGERVRRAAVAGGDDPWRRLPEAIVAGSPAAATGPARLAIEEVRRDLLERGAAG